MFGVHFEINSKLYIRNPEETKLGRQIISDGVILIEELGIESFNFKKLAAYMESTEASVYRYFTGKYSLLTYLINWYWAWVLYLIETKTNNIIDPKNKLERAIESIVTASIDKLPQTNIDIELLHKVVIAEGAKVYHRKNVDDLQRDNLFAGYISAVQLLSAIIHEVSPSFKYPTSLASNIFEMANNQVFFAHHVPKLTEIKNSKSIYHDTYEMILEITNRAIKTE